MYIAIADIIEQKEAKFKTHQVKRKRLYKICKYSNFEEFQLPK